VSVQMRFCDSCPKIQPLPNQSRGRGNFILHCGPVTAPKAAKVLINGITAKVDFPARDLTGFPTLQEFAQ
jgi:hypothetical protein